MTKVREHYWVPRLRRLTKKIVKSYNRCRRFRARAFSCPLPGNLPRDRTEGQIPFQVVGVDYAGPLKYRKKAKTKGKAYVLLYACSLTRALFLDLLPNLETTEFLASLKRFIDGVADHKEFIQTTGERSWEQANGLSRSCMMRSSTTL